MGAGKSTVGRRLAKRLKVEFLDSDDEIMKAAGCSIEDIFELYGEAEFRAGEKRVMDRLITEGPMVLATGGGVFMNDELRAKLLRNTITVWLKAGLDTLAERTARRGGRPLLRTGDPRKTLEKLIQERYPVYGQADIVLNTDTETLQGAVGRIVTALKRHLKDGTQP
ncbi:MAG: shikimate kinase [Alphaproteobacteria bacterium]|nr:shikimate kinase [Alphaproteobacteria bacterium]